MSAHSRRLVVATEARRDLRDVLVFTETHWGRTPSLEYERLILDALDKLTNFPHLGRPRPDYGPDFHSFRVRQHIIIYQLTDTEIRIARIWHIRRDAEGAFGAAPE